MRKIIRTDGTELVLDKPRTMTEIEALIGASTLDSVSLRHLGRPLHVMLLDDGGHHTKHVETAGHLQIISTGHRKPVNEKATALYWANCRPGTTHQIVGDVAIVPDSDFA